MQPQVQKGQMSPQKQRLIIMLLAGFFGLLIIIGVAITLLNGQKGKVVIRDITPHDATVKLDGNVVGKGTEYVEPGKHQFVLTHPAFKEKKVDFEIKAGETQGFDIWSVPLDDSVGRAWLEQNPEEAMKIDGYGSAEYIRESERVFDNNAILSELPIIDRGFRIDHGFSKEGRDFALYIQSADEEGKQAALDTLEYMGYDPKNFEIIYTQPE
jgi:hypothetical protein